MNTEITSVLTYGVIGIRVGASRQQAIAGISFTGQAEILSKVTLGDSTCQTMHEAPDVEMISPPPFRFSGNDNNPLPDLASRVREHYVAAMGTCTRVRGEHGHMSYTQPGATHAKRPYSGGPSSSPKASRLH